MNLPDRLERIGARIDALLRHERTPQLVTAFYQENGPFAGDTFLKIGSNPRASVGRDDLLAVTLLDVRVPPRAVRWFQRSSSRRRISKDLGKSRDTNLWQATDDDLEPAYSLWGTLTEARQNGELKGVGGVTLDKLLARKRPHLMPIVDRIIAEALGISRSDDYWKDLRQVLAHGDRWERLESLQRTESRRPPLRLLDAALWMWGSRSSNAAEVRRGMDVERNAYRV